MLKHGGPKMKRKLNKDVKPRSVTYEFIISPSFRNGLAYHDIQISWQNFDFPPTPIRAMCKQFTKQFTAPQLMPRSETRESENDQ